jgi:hypothetical protein
MENQSQILVKMEQLRRDQCVKIVNMAEFLNDPFISVVFDKAVTLGYDVEVIKEIFVEFLIDLQFKASDLRQADFDSLIDAEKFIDRLIVKSSQQEARSGAASANWPEQEEEENEEDFFEPDYSRDG